MVDIDTGLIVTKPKINIVSPYQSFAPTYKKPTINVDKPDTSKVTLATMNVVRNIPHNTLAFESPTTLIKQVESKRQMSLSPTAKQNVLDYQATYKKKMNILPASETYPDTTTYISGQEDVVGTKVIKPVKARKTELIVGSISGVETLKKPKDISKKFVKSFGTELKEEFSLKKSFIDRLKEIPTTYVNPVIKSLAKAYTTIDPDVSAYLEQTAYQGDKNPFKEAGKEVGVGVGRALQGVISPGAYIIGEPEKVARALPAIVTKVPEMVKSEIYFAKKFPLIATTELASGFITDELIGDPVGKSISSGVTKLKKIITKLSPDYKKVKVNPFGYEEITDIKGLSGKDIDIVLVPGRGAKKPKLNVSKIVDDFGNVIPLTDTPKLPKTTNKSLTKILDVVKDTDNIISGSYSQQALLKKDYTRPFKDLDIGAPDVDATVNAIVDKLGKKNVRILQQPTATTIIDIKTGVELADIVPLSVSEGGWAVKYKPIEIDGVKLADPRSRLAGKSTALSMNIKVYKTVPDIEALIGQPGALSPLVSGRSGFGFGFTEQAEYFGKTGTLVSGQREIFKKGLFGTEFLAGKERYAYKPSSNVLESSFFVSPFDITTGKPLLRISRLATSKADDLASIWDLVSGKAEFGTGKQSQILLFENQKIADVPTELKSLFKKAKAGDVTAKKSFFSKYRKYQLEDSPIFKPLGFDSSELELTAFKQTIQKKAKVGTTIIDDSIVPIYSAELKGATKVSKSLGSAEEFLTRTKPVIDAKDIFYHGTTKDNAQNIIKDGLKSASDVKFTRGIEGFATNVDPYQNRIFLTDSLDSVKMYSGSGDVVKLDLSKFKKKVISTDKYGLSKIEYSLGDKKYFIYKQGDLGEFYTLKNIKSSDLSLVGNNAKNVGVVDNFIDGVVSEKEFAKIKSDLKTRGAKASIINELDELYKKSKLKSTSFTDEIKFYNLLNRDYSSPITPKKIYRPERLIKFKTLRKTVSKVMNNNSAESFIAKNAKSYTSIIKSLKPTTVKTNKGVRQTINQAVSSDLAFIKKGRSNLPVSNSSYKPIKTIYKIEPIKSNKYTLPIKSIKSTLPIIPSKYSPDPIRIETGGSVPPYPPSPITGGYVPKTYPYPTLPLNGGSGAGRVKSSGKAINKGKKATIDAFGVEVRKAGIWTRVGNLNDRHNKNSAISLGIQETGNSPARSFRLIPLSGKANMIKRKTPKMLTRYYKKKGRGNKKLANAYIEKPKFAIDSQAEINNITKVGWQTNRNLKKQRQKQKSMLSRLLGNNRR